MPAFSFDVAHMSIGALVLISFMLIYQRRLPALINMLALHAGVLACSVAWQAHIQGALRLYIAAAIALGVNGIAAPMALRRIALQPGVHREIETVPGTALTMLAGILLVALSLQVLLPITGTPGSIPREDVALAFSVVLLGLLMTTTRRHAISQLIGLILLENGILLAVSGTQGFPLTVAVSVAFAILTSLIVAGLFLFHSPERMDIQGVLAHNPRPAEPQ